MSSPTWAFRPIQHLGIMLVETLRMIAPWNGRWTVFLTLAIYAGCLAAFITDLTSANTLAFGVFYAPLVVTAVFHEDSRAVWVLCALASVMVVAGAYFPVIDPDLTALIGNRALSLCAVFATAAFVHHARLTQDQLAGQTRRAEAAEHMKTEVLTNLSHEIRAPLHSMIGVLELMAADSRPEQKAALYMIRGSGRRLVATVDNLVDLTQFEDKPLPAEPVDAGMMLHQVIESHRSDATLRQINLTLTLPPGTTPPVHANPWGLRRILENLIADAILYTAPGGRIEAHTSAEDQHVCIVITDTGTRPPGTPRTAGEINIDRLMPSVMGLALSQRLTRAIGARLTFNTRPGEGTTAWLRLPIGERREGPGTHGAWADG